MTIYNEVGQQVLTSLMDGNSLAEQGVDMSSLPAGAYHIKVVSGEINETLRLVKQ